MIAKVDLNGLRGIELLEILYPRRMPSTWLEKMVESFCWNNSHQVLIELINSGVLSTRIDTFFACLREDNSASSQFRSDIVIAGGAGSDSLLYKLEACSFPDPHYPQEFERDQNLRIDSISNWTPLSDLCIGGISSSRAPDEHRRASIFVANGTSPEGKISELRHGLRARVDDHFDGMSGCTGLWVLGYISEIIMHEGEKYNRHRVSFIITLPLQSTLIEIDCKQPHAHESISDIWQEGQWRKMEITLTDGAIPDHVIRHEETLSACVWSEECSIQISRTMVQVLRLSTGLQSSSFISLPEPLLIAASLPAYPYVAIAYNESSSIYIEIIPIFSGGVLQRSQGARFHLPHDPTCIELFNVDGVSYIFVSTFNSQIIFFRTDSSGIHSINIKGSIGNIQSTNTQMLCESAAMLTSKGQRTLICTTRDGFLLQAKLKFPIDGKLQLLLAHLLDTNKEQKLRTWTGNAFD